MSKYDTETKTWHGLQIPYHHPMDVTIGDLVMKNLLKNPDRILQICADDDTTLTSDQLRILSIRVAQNLKRIGIQEDDVIGLITHHSHFATCFITGCIFMGALINPLDGLMSDDDIRQVYNKSKPKIIVCDGEVILKLQNALKNVDFDYRIYSTDNAVSSYHLKAKNFLRKTGDEDNFTPPKFSKPSDQKIFAILCSSGTTGTPKSVCLSHATVIGATSFYSIFSVPTSTKSILFSPLYWVTGFYANVSISFSERETRVVTARKFSVETFIDLVEKYEITNVFMGPYVLNTLLMNADKFLSSNTKSLQNFVSIGAILSEEARKKFDEILPNRNLTVAYGMTEQGVTVSKPLEYRQNLSVGSFILPNVSLRINDEEGNALNNGQIGEICTKSMFKFSGYYNDPEATKELIDKDGFIKTGDLGYINDDGMLFIVDRKKDILKYKGMQVNPSDIENVIESIEGVQAVSVVGIPDELCVNLITAAVVKRDGFDELSENEIIQHVASKLPEYKQLSGGVYFFDKFPTTLSDKVMKRSILECILILKVKKS